MSGARTATGKLVLIPVSLGEARWQRFLPDEAWRCAAAIRHFVVETPKTARAQLKRLEHPLPIRELDIRSLPERNDKMLLDALLAAAFEGNDIGLMSDAGCPAVADPGAWLVARAHVHDIAVQPLVGPSSLLLALMASGLNGQSFSFHGYLPVAEAERAQQLRRLEDESRQQRRTQLFIETPYRNDKMFEALLQVCAPTTLLCVARDLNTDQEWIHTRAISVWRKSPRPDLAKRPAMFLLLAS